jgi:CRP-like cAMP-binding protein
MFMPLGPAALEAAARHLVPLDVAASTPVVRQGEAGDRWYLVREGRLVVDVDGRALAELGPGDGFGEIALLHDVPRTATVTALTDVSLWSLEREEFLAAVTGAASAYAEAERLAAERIAEQHEGPAPARLTG